ncbi:hypothetical protein B0H13DRAFT_1039678 [Mycena leptocephala]|nr:hypothetical protein B0H13DRAFT_1039678 [Mycena leptocephala]
MNPSFEFLRALPTPPNINIADIKGNATDEEKLINAKGFHHFITMGDFGTDISKRLRLTGLSFDDARRECELTLEIEVIKDMGNFLGVLHGACSTLLAEIGCSTSVIMVGSRLGVDARVLTRAMEITFSYPAQIGDTLEIISTGTILKNGVPNARCEIRNKKSGKICATLVQSLARPGKAKL